MTDPQATLSDEELAAIREYHLGPGKPGCCAFWQKISDEKCKICGATDNAICGRWVSKANTHIPQLLATITALKVDLLAANESRDFWMKAADDQNALTTKAEAELAFVNKTNARLQSLLEGEADIKADLAQAGGAAKPLTIETLARWYLDFWEKPANANDFAATFYTSFVETFGNIAAELAVLHEEVSCHDAEQAGWEDDCAELREKLAQANAGVAVLTEALTDISRGAGAYSSNPLQHASNCIDDMKQTALNALANLPAAAQALIAEKEGLRQEINRLQTDKDHLLTRAEKAEARVKYMEDLLP